MLLRAHCEPFAIFAVYVLCSDRKARRHEREGFRLDLVQTHHPPGTGTPALLAGCDLGDSGR